MLVLSRRLKEKILFPALGISIEVVSLSAKKTQLGIDAPRGIRVIREELCAISEDGPVPNFSPDEIQEDLDAASLAIHLAQNQLRQGLSVYAEDALDNALANLKVIEEKLSFNAENESCLVREPKCHYKLPQPKIRFVIEQWRNELLDCYGSLG